MIGATSLARLAALRGGLDELSPSMPLALACACVALLASEAAAYAIDGKIVPATIVVSAFFLVFMTWWILRLSARQSNFPSALFAFSAAEIAVAAVLLAAAPWGRDAFSDDANLRTTVTFLAVLGVTVLWSIAVRTRVWSLALGRSVHACLLLVLGLMACEIAAVFALS